MQAGWSDVPPEHSCDERWNEYQKNEDAQEASHVSEDTHREFANRSPQFDQHGANQERKSTSSRWNIFTARNSAAAA